MCRFREHLAHPTAGTRTTRSNPGHGSTQPRRGDALFDDDGKLRNEKAPEAPEEPKRKLERIQRRRADAWARRAGIREQMIRPAGWFVTLVAIVTGAGAVMEGKEWPDPSWWDPGGGAAWFVFGALGVGALLLTAGLVFWLDRALTRRTNDLALEQHCRSIARYAMKEYGMPPDHIGVHVWELQDKRFRLVPHRLGDWVASNPDRSALLLRLTSAPFLSRRAAYIPERRLHPPLRFMKGRGVIGIAWRLDREVVHDLTYLREAENAEQFYEMFGYDERLGLSWRDWWSTRQFCAIWAYPLYGGSAGTRRFIGCVSFDVQLPDYVEQLHDLVENKDAELESLLWDCAAVLTGRSES